VWFRAKKKVRGSGNRALLLSSCDSDIDMAPGGEAKVKRKGAEDSPIAAKKVKASNGAENGKGKSRAREEGTTKIIGTFNREGILKDKSKVVLRTAPKHNAYEIGAVLVSSSDFVPPRDVEYTLHHRQAATASSSSQGATLQDRLVFAGESDTMDYVAWNFDMGASVNDDTKERQEARGYAGEYMVGVFDPEKSTVTLRAAPVFSLSRSIKSLSSFTMDQSSGTRDWQERMQARRGLGETFGNRKTKLKARNADRMKVDTSNMLDVMNIMQEGIEEATFNIPTEEDMKEEADQARPIPPANLNALIPQEAYPLNELIPDAIFRLLNVKFLQNVESATQLGRILPYDGPNNSAWLKDRMWPLIQVSQLAHNKMKNKMELDDEAFQSSPSTSGILKSSTGANREESKTKLKILWYIALLWSFVKIVARRDKGGDKEALLKKLKLDQAHGGEAIIDDLFARFAQTERGSLRGQVTSFTETKLYAHMFALCLHLENFSIDPTSLSRDLGLGPTRVTEIFKSLGCTTAKKAIFQADGSSKQERMLVLKCPLELPKPRRGRAPQKK
jgi:DNA-directed RNA polymerase I subunit RPA49